MALEDQPYNYELPAERIAERPLRPYDTARLLLVERSTGKLGDFQFTDLPDLLEGTEVFCFNNTKVIKSRLFARAEGREKEVEIFIIKKQSEDIFLCLARPLRILKSGMRLHVDSNLRAIVLERSGEQHIMLRFECDDGETETALEKAALMPIPPYIRKGRADGHDVQDYQSLFASLPGSIAAPTASLHFTPRLISALKGKGISIEELTLHLGQGSFRTLWDGDNSSELRPPEAEMLACDGLLPGRLAAYRAAGRRIVAVGTSMVRALESLSLTAEAPQELAPTDLFIRPGFEFRMTDALITNFHFPASSHLLLVQALIGKELLDKAYRHALASGYRFLSYGDGMLIR